MGLYSGNNLPIYTIRMEIPVTDAVVLRRMAQEEDGTAKVYIREAKKDSPAGTVEVEVLTFLVPLLRKTIERFNARGGIKIELEELL